MNDNPPIWYPHEAFYIEAMLFVTNSAMTSAKHLSKMILQYLEDPRQISTDDALNHLQNIVHQAGALSRYFWPTQPPRRPRGKYLRDTLKVKEESPLRSREVRNWLEHFDEKLDDYLKKHMPGEYVPRYFGPKPPDDGMPRHFFRAYYPEIQTFEILEVQIKMQPLIDEMKRVHNQLVGYREGGLCLHQEEI